jgi:hypothetical protein
MEKKIKELKTTEGELRENGFQQSWFTETASGTLINHA